jgi:hypothetical protein
MALSFLVWGDEMLCEGKQTCVGMRRMKKGESVGHDVAGKPDGTCYMIDGLPGIVTHDERIVGQS